MMTEAESLQLRASWWYEAANLLGDRFGTYDPMLRQEIYAFCYEQAARYIPIK